MIQIKRIEFDQYGAITAIDFVEGADADEVIQFLVDFRIPGGTVDSLKRGLENYRQRTPIAAQNDTPQSSHS